MKMYKMCKKVLDIFLDDGNQIFIFMTNLNAPTRGDPMGSKSATWRIQMWGKVLLGSKWISIICNVIILSDFLMCCYAQTNPKNIISSQ